MESSMTISSILRALVIAPQDVPPFNTCNCEKKQKNVTLEDVE